MSVQPAILQATLQAIPARSKLRAAERRKSAVEELLRRTAGERLWEQLHPDEVKEVERERVQFE